MEENRTPGGLVMPPRELIARALGARVWRRRVVQGPDPAAGAEIVVTVGEGELWYVHSVRFPLVSDATAVTRAVALLVDDGTSVFFEAMAGATQAASLTMNYTFSGAGFGNSEAGVRTAGGLISRVPLLRGYRLRTVTTNLQAGDNYGPPVLCIDELMP